MKHICFETRSVSLDYFLDRMSFYEGFEVMKYSQYVDIYDRTMLRNLGYFILQKGNKQKVNIEKILPLPFDKQHVTLAEKNFVSDFNTEWLKDYDKKMEEFNRKAESLIENKKNMEFEVLDLKKLLTLQK